MKLHFQMTFLLLSTSCLPKLSNVCFLNGYPLVIFCDKMRLNYFNDFGKSNITFQCRFLGGCRPFWVLLAVLVGRCGSF